MYEVEWSGKKMADPVKDPDVTKTTPVIAVLLVVVSAVIFGFVIWEWADKATPDQLNQIVVMILSSLLTAFGLVIGHYFSKKQ